MLLLIPESTWVDGAAAGPVRKTRRNAEPFSNCEIVEKLWLTTSHILAQYAILGYCLGVLS